jgi:hypothetical protein
LSYIANGENFSNYVKRLKSGEVIKNNKNQWSDPNYKDSQESKDKRIATRIKNGNVNHTDESRKAISVAMNEAVMKYPESFSSSNRGRVKQVLYKGIKFQGNWELDFYKWCETNNVRCLRNTEGFRYQWNGSRTYFPDFFLPDKNEYVEVKGFKTDRDEAKWDHFPRKLRLILKDDIINIRNNNFVYDDASIWAPNKISVSSITDK